MIPLVLLACIGSFLLAALVLWWGIYQPDADDDAARPLHRWGAD